MKQQLLIVKIFNDFLLRHDGKELSSFPLPVFIAYLKSAGGRYTNQLTSMEVAALVIAFANKRKSNSHINKALVLVLSENAAAIIKRSKTVTVHELLNRHCLHHDTIAGVSTSDREQVKENQLIVELKQARKSVDECFDRLNLFSDPVLSVLTNNNITQVLINKYLRDGIIKVLKSEYHELVFSNQENIATLFRRISKHPRPDDSPYLLIKINRYADLAARAA